MCRIVSRSVGYNGNTIASETMNYTYDGLIAGLGGASGGYLFPSGHTPSVVTSATYNPDGTPSQVHYGDPAHTTETYTYDANGLAQTYRLTRPAGTLGTYKAWVATTPTPSLVPPSYGSTTQDDLANVTISRDLVGNPIQIADNAAAPWPSGAKATAPLYTYDDPYRLLTVDSSKTPDSWRSPYEPESSQGDLSPYALPKSEPSRVSSQAYTYDARENMCSWTDDLHDVTDRSLGTAIYYDSGGGARSPSNPTPIGPGFEKLGIGVYPTPNDGMYLTNMNFGGVYTYNLYQGVMGNTVRSYVYYWDEVGRLSAAIHGKGTNQVATETYTYDGDGNRIRQDRATYINNTWTDLGATFRVFDMLVVKNVPYNYSTSTWSAPTAGNTDVYLGGGTARMLNDASNVLPHTGTSRMHTFLRFADQRGSNAFVVDYNSSEVVERTTYQAYGALDADYRPSRWNYNREDFKQTGNWDNAEVALVYMNNRYYSPQLGRFISADPLTIHGLAGDPNPYAYANGNPIMYTDPTGLAGWAAGKDWVRFYDDPITGHAAKSAGAGAATAATGEAPAPGDSASGAASAAGGAAAAIVDFALDTYIADKMPVGIPPPSMTPALNAGRGQGQPEIGMPTHPVMDWVHSHFRPEDRLVDVISIVSVFIPGPDAVPGLEAGLKAVEEAAEILSRFGTKAESAARLGRKAAEGEAQIGIHGVSTTAASPRVPSSQAARSAVEQHFPVRNTGADPMHRTVLLPKPVTQEIADLFNRLFGRRP